MEKVKVSPKGQVVIPKQLRDRFGIEKDDDEVLVEDEEMNFERFGIRIMSLFLEDPCLSNLVLDKRLTDDLEPHRGYRRLRDRE